MAKSNKTQKQKLMNLLASGQNVPAKTLAKKLGVRSVSAHISNLRNEGARIYTNKTSDGTAYRFDALRSYTA